MNRRTYSELMSLQSYNERFEYLRLKSTVGKDTFGYNRYLNQILYQSSKWKRFRRGIIFRDNGCDLACEGYEINSWKDKNGKIHRPRIIIHHMNPITIDDILHCESCVFDPENVITTVHNTHNAIHYGDENLLITSPVERTANDTCLWK